ncbi:hypothetical protein HPB51_014241 [Rhipicephalus microplus]|uniref:Myb/SANT-like DNA-binding domain-containing protein n=1 Tax=Rhipicephalus microplus TaxID=6941 RepID=A0A9J6D5E7_RHIMP|nr:hypothetical protein HPB51_014241 [Rhipicephalus microplus]
MCADPLTPVPSLVICAPLDIYDGVCPWYHFNKDYVSDTDTRLLIRLWEEHLSDLRRAKRNSKIYAAIAEKIEALGCKKKSTKEVKKKIANILEGIAQGDVQDEQLNDGNPSLLPVAAPEPSCFPQRSTSPPTAGHPAITESASSCEAGLDSDNPKKAKESEGATYGVNTYGTAAGRATPTSSFSRMTTR